jgi:hypothetical protein
MDNRSTVSSSLRGWSTAAVRRAGIRCLALGLQPPRLAQPRGDPLPRRAKLPRVAGEQREVIHVALVAWHAERSTHEVVQLVEVQVAPELAGQVADRQASVLPSRALPGEPSDHVATPIEFGATVNDVVEQSSQRGCSMLIRSIGAKHGRIPQLDREKWIAQHAMSSS